MPGAVDGDGGHARFNAMFDLLCLPDGRILVTDKSTQALRVITIIGPPPAPPSAAGRPQPDNCFPASAFDPHTSDTGSVCLAIAAGVAGGLIGMALLMAGDAFDSARRAKARMKATRSDGCGAPDLPYERLPDHETVSETTDLLEMGEEHGIQSLMEGSWDATAPLPVDARPPS